MSEQRDDYLRSISARTPEIVVGNTDAARQEILRAAFNVLCNPVDWKAPINALLDPQDANIGLYIEAVQFMTATAPSLFITNNPAPMGGYYLRLVSEGYRAGPAGP